MKTIHSLIWLLILASIHSCVSVKSTFEEQYTTKIPFKPDEHAVMSADGNSIFLIGTTHNLLSTRTRISKVRATNGESEWNTPVSRLGDMVGVPSNIIVIENKNIALLFGTRPGNSLRRTQYIISAIDMQTQKELWSYKQSSGSISMGGLYLDKNQSFVVQTQDGMQSFDILTGEVLWKLEGMSSRVNIGRFSLTLSSAQDINFIYLESMERLLLEVHGKSSLINPYTGQFEWQIEDEIGSYLDADIFETHGLAVFYGRDLSANRQVSSSANTSNRTLNTLSGVSNRLQSASGRGAQNSPIIMVDLKTGRLVWRNQYYTNGQQQVYLTQDKLLISGIVSYAFDVKTGEKTWQNVTDDRLSREGILGTFAEFTGIDYTSDRHTMKEAVVIDNTLFVVFPEMLEEGGNRNHVSLRAYDYITGEQLWKTDGQRQEVRNMFFERGILFVVLNGRFARASRMIAIDPYSGEQLYEIDARQTLNQNLIFTDDIIYTLGLSGNLTMYDIRTGEVLERERLGRFVSDVIDMQDRLLVVYRTSGGQTMAFHNRNTFQLIEQVEVPFYSRTMFTVNNKLFMVREEPQFKGIVHLDLNTMQVYGHATISTSGSKSSKNKPGNVILDPYRFMVSADGQHLYLIRKKKLVQYSLTPQS